MSIQASRSYGIGLALLAATAFVACSAEDDSGTKDDNKGGTSNAAAGSGTAGTALTAAGHPGAGGSGSGGSSPGTAGTGTAGSGTAGAGTAGSGGGGNGFTCAMMKPASATVTEFMDLTPNATNAGQFNFTLGVPGGTFAYQAAALTVTDATGALNIKGNVMAYDGFGVYFTACTDASSYTGVSFNIKGNAGPKKTLNFRIQTNANTAVDMVNKKGACMVPAGTTDTYPLCHPGGFDIPVTPEGATVEVKFSQMAGGVPVATVDGKDLVGLEWAFAWAGAGDTAYDADVTIDDIKLTGGGTVGGTGSGGSGGSGGSSGGGAGGSGGTQ
jgi:hypothetical protein